jgi:modulator of FtsH protease
MALYDRNYTNAYANEYEQTATRDESALKSFIKQTYQLFAASLLAGTAGAYVGLGMAPVIASFYWGLVILEFALIIGLNFTKDKPSLALGMLFGFTFISGLTLAPLLSAVIGINGGGGIVANAFLMTTATFGALTMFAMNSTKDFTSFGKPLFIALIVVVVVGIINIFLGSPILQVVIAGVSAILFSFFILYDTQNIIRGNYNSPVLAASALYLDFLNLFISLLQILGIFGGGDE